MNQLIEELKQLIIDSLDLEDVKPADIDAKAPLFGSGGLGLDSIDALELGVAVQKRYQVKLDANSADTRQHFHSVESLAAFIRSQQSA
ncbi:MAG TPA: phosphopantetheine-binding protein [Gammaproteobacteria bacterium]|jgi:acyl carrier protein|nr:phosphopantetheine-binding protein [Gammaproteobacteria bacterium]